MDCETPGTAKHKQCKRSNGKKIGFSKFSIFKSSSQEDQLYNNNNKCSSIKHETTLKIERERKNILAVFCCCKMISFSRNAQYSSIYRVNNVMHSNVNHMSAKKWQHPLNEIECNAYEKRKYCTKKHKHTRDECNERTAAKATISKEGKKQC